MRNVRQVEQWNPGALSIVARWAISVCRAMRAAADEQNARQSRK